MQGSIRLTAKQIDVAVAQIAAVFDQLSVPVLVFRLDGQTLYCSQQFQEILRASSSQLRNVFDSAHAFWQRQDVQDLVKATLDPGFNGVARLDGIHCLVGLEKQLQTDLVIELFGEHRDLRLVRLLNYEANEYHLVTATESESDSDPRNIMIRGLMHEVNNPLGGIRGSAQMLQMGDSDEKEIAELAVGVIADVDRIRNIIEQFGRTGDMATIEPQWHHLHELLFEIVHNAEQGAFRKIDFRLEVDIGLPPLWFDPNKLGQVLTNLLVNATHFTGDDRRVDIRARVFSGPAIIDGKRPKWLRVRVEDSGIGVLGLENKLFTPFYTTRAGGTGLGLAISQSIVKAMGGSVQAGTSQLGGAALTVEIPVEIQGTQ